MLKQNQKLIFIGIVVMFFIVTPMASVLAQNIENSDAPVNQYFSPEEVKRADTIIFFISSFIFYTINWICGGRFYRLIADGKKSDNK